MCVCVYVRACAQSLSEEQQRFAKAYRAMQLEGSVFAVLIVPLKPQLEVLLGLEKDSLTKEIQLTQRLLDLFIEHQVRDTDRATACLQLL